MRKTILFIIFIIFCLSLSYFVVSEFSSCTGSRKHEAKPSAYLVYAKAQEKLFLAIPLYAKDSVLSSDYVEGLNPYLTEKDIIFIKGKSTIVKLINKIKKAKLAIIRQSISDLEKDIKFLNSYGIKFDYLCYNPEDYGTSYTPEEEKKDLILAVKKAKDLADKYKVGLIVVTDSKKTLPKYGEDMAKYADIFLVQLQAWQLSSNEEFRKKAQDLISVVKKGNPDIPIFVQLATNPPTGKREEGKGKVLMPVTTQDLISKVKLISDLIDGVGFLLLKEGGGLERFKKFLERYREAP